MASPSLVPALRPVMVRSYLIVAWRFLVRHRVRTFISVAGLALGMSCCLLLLLYVQHEWNYDRFHEKADRLVQVLGTYREANGDPVVQARLAAPIGPALVRTFPEVRAAVRVASEPVRIIVDREPVEQDVLFADASLFDVFSFPLVARPSETVLDAPDEVVLTASAAMRYFGDPRPLGAHLRVALGDTTLDLRVSAIAREVPSNSSIRFDVVLPYVLFQHTVPAVVREEAMRRWDYPVGSTFLLLDRARVEGALARKLSAFSRSHFDEAVLPIQLMLRPLRHVHFSPGVQGMLRPPADPWHTYALAAIGFIILLLACLNVATLSLAASTERAREVGVRKAVGACRAQIRRQFLAEALLLSSIGGLLAVGLATILLPHFSMLVDRPLGQVWTQRPVVVLSLLVGAVVAGAAGGVYPAFVLSRQEPAHTLRGAVVAPRRSLLVNSVMFTQFAATMVLGIAAVVVTAQMHHLLTRPLGLQKEQVVVLQTPDIRQGQQIFERLRQRLAREPRVQAISSSWTSPFGHPGWPAELVLGDTATVRVFMNAIGPDFVPALGMRLASGRDLSVRRTADEKHAVLVNEAFLRTLGWRTPYGKELPIQASILSRTEVVGVVKDYHFRSFHHEIEPVVLVPSAALGGGAGVIFVRLTAGSPLAESLAALKAHWVETAPEAPFDYRFMDEMVASQYRDEQRWRTLLQSATTVALLISCLGLFGMSALVAEQRTKEVGIRKVLGASTTGLVWLLSTDVARLVVLALAVAMPVAFVLARQWLRDFAYHITLTPALFLLSGLAMLLIVLLTTGYHTVRAALANPVNSLRSE